MYGGAARGAVRWRNLAYSGSAVPSGNMDMAGGCDALVVFAAAGDLRGLRRALAFWKPVSAPSDGNDVGGEN